MTRCGFCNTEMAEGQAFCPNCGLEGGRAPDAVAPVVELPKKSSDLAPKSKPTWAERKAARLTAKLERVRAASVQPEPEPTPVNAENEAEPEVVQPLIEESALIVSLAIELEKAPTEPSGQTPPPALELPAIGKSEQVLEEPEAPAADSLVVGSAPTITTATETVALISDSVVLGRMPAPTTAGMAGQEQLIQVPDANGTISRTHALLMRDASGAWSLTDLGSQNGTKVQVVGEHQVELVYMENIELGDGAAITLGDVELIFAK